MADLVLDARWLSTGLGTYTLNLLQELDKCSDISVRVLTLPENRERLAHFRFEISIVDAPIYSFTEQIKVPWAVRNSEILHSPHYNAPLMHRGTLLVTIHDLNHLLDKVYRKSIKSWIYARPMLHMVSRRADHIFTVSEYSKRQVVEHLGVDPGHITVVYIGAGPHIFPEDHDLARDQTNRTFGFTGPYVLFVGNLKSSKNTGGLIRAFAILKNRLQVPHRLLIIGDDQAGRPAMMKLSRDLGLDSSVVFVPHTDGDRIRSAYSGAELTALPSFQEGFGLPVLESMACGTPVACSRAASLPEVAGRAAEYFDPWDVESIAAAIEKVLSSSDRACELRNLGLERAKLFTREASTERHIAVYRQFLRR
jgi:glycosyltransferase involved in cell wall biosynthesis